MVYFSDNDHCLHMAVSMDGYEFTAVNDNYPVIAGDTTAYPIACHIMWPERPNPAFDIIKGNIYVSDGKELGIKVIK